LEILPPAQRRLWDELGALPSEFVLYGGTAVALHRGHRASLDFDFFGWTAFDPDDPVPVVVLPARCRSAAEGGG
jgi:nucleotidyltransferase AbiEii toxin of type IV toxin-antitoxin system